MKDQGTNQDIRELYARNAPSVGADEILGSGAASVACLGSAHEATIRAQTTERPARCRLRVDCHGSGGRGRHRKLHCHPQSGPADFRARDHRRQRCQRRQRKAGIGSVSPWQARAGACTAMRSRSIRPIARRSTPPRIPDYSSPPTGLGAGARFHRARTSSSSPSTPPHRPRYMRWSTLQASPSQSIGRMTAEHLDGPERVHSR